MLTLTVKNSSPNSGSRPHTQITEKHTAPTCQYVCHCSVAEVVCPTQQKSLLQACLATRQSSHAIQQRKDSRSDS